MFVTSLVQEFRDDFSHPMGSLQLGAIVVTYLIAWLLAKKIHQYLEKDIEKVKVHIRFVLSAVHFTVMLKFIFWLLLVWFCQVLFKEFAIPARFLPMSLSLIVALMVIRFASSYIKNKFWSRFVYVICLVVLSLRIFKLWDPTVRLLDSMTIGLGKICI
jgi:hypothetical protein